MAEEEGIDVIPKPSFSNIVKSQQMSSESRDKILFTLKYFLAGGVGGILYCVSIHPLDTIKTRLQTNVNYDGVIASFRRIFVKEGIKGFYKGMAAPLLASTPLSAVMFWSYGIGKVYQLKSPEDELTNVQIVKAGMFCGFVSSFLMTPMERIKCVLQVQEAANMAHAKYTGPWDCAKKLGVTGVYKGYCATLLRDIPATGIYFVLYEGMLKWFNEGKRRDQFSSLSIIFAGGLAGVAECAFIWPIDVLKSRVQVATQDMPPRNAREALWLLLRDEGPRALVKGAHPLIFKAFPACSACFLGFEFTLSLLNRVLPTSSQYH